MGSEMAPARRGRPRKYENVAEKSRAYRQRLRQKLAALEAHAAGAAAPASGPPEDGKPRTGKELLDALVASGFIGAWEDRADIGDSGAFARKLRREAERREWD